MQNESSEPLNIRPVAEADIPLVLEFIRDIAEYERLSDQVVADEAILRESLFGARAKAEGLIAERAGEPAAFAIYFENFSTFTGRPGLYLEDLFVKPTWRQHGIGRAMLVRLAQIAVERGCPRFEWVALDWNQNAIDFYEKLGAKQLNDWRIFRMEGDSIARLAAQVIDN
jgi:GNAT superfamily N-acetyltransferase